MAGVILFPNRILADDAAHRFRDWRENHPAADLDERQAMENELFASPTVWRCPPVGRIQELRLESVEVGSFSALVLASDGFLLDVDGLERGPDLMFELADPKDDACLISIRRDEASN